ncbi:mandelate racemase [Dactylosporangium aurantiacum]|uniref:Mandelate racemase n=1 Tax=Dactylosporangium aurantiacum TaxID=35754 RepID=A0A9Q9ML63_9ACTN|nr:enolase C-terminal domain-like protein [Dactylosporangium aurantiacum]MDG6110344.1 enolase C-terminal domain-like protein [Dactylosporangium aurantiacum]UWZ58630.1 mandelate racemase [Dactylosporangium aurantiacum]
MPVEEPSIDAVTAAAFTIPTDQPEADGTAVWSSTTIVVVHAVAGNITGLGWTYGAAAGARLVRDVLADAVVGRCAFDVTAAYEAMWRTVRNIGRPGIASTSISAVDTALWDLKARLLDIRLSRLLGVAHEAVPVYGSGGFTTYDERQLTEQLKGWIEDFDVRSVKIKIGQDRGACTDRDVDRMRQAREVIGPAIELFVDANGAYSVKQAMRIAERTGDLDVRWFEEPVSSDNLGGLRRVRDAVAAEVTAGEYGYGLSYFQRMCAAGAVDCLQADVTRCGGVTEFQRVAAVAAAYDLDVSGHCAPNLHLDVAATVPNLRHLEYFHDHARIETLLFDGATSPVRGAMSPDLSAPGNGLTFRAADAEHYRVA